MEANRELAAKMQHIFVCEAENQLKTLFSFVPPPCHIAIDLSGRRVKKCKKVQLNHIHDTMDRQYLSKTITFRHDIKLHDSHSQLCS